MRQNDRWDEVAGLVVRYRDAGVVGFDLAGPEIGFPPDRIPSAIALLDRARARTARSTRARPTGSRASGRPWTAPTRSGWATACGSPTRCADDGALGPLAQRVLDEQVPLEIAPSSNVQTGAYPSLAAHPVDRLHRLGFAVTLNTDNRLMSGVSVSSELTDVATTFGWSLGRRPDGDRARAGRRVPPRGASGTGCSTTSSARGTRRCAADPAGG